MSAASPALNAGLLVNCSITVDGEALDTGRLVSVETWTEANRIPRARIVFYDGEPDNGVFPLSESDSFAPGKKIEIAVGYSGDSAVIHNGVVVRHSVRILPGASSQLVVETADPLLKMTASRNSAITPSTTDSALIATLIQNGGGTVGTNKAATDQHEALVQYHASDWDLLLIRAEASGCVVVTADSKVDIIAPTTKTTPLLSLEYGDSLISFEASVDAASQYAQASIKSRSWGYSDQKIAEGAASSADVEVPGNFKSSTLAEVLGVAEALQQSGALIAADQLAGWSTARLMRARLSQYRGTARFQGSALVKPGAFVTLAGLGERFNGDAFVGGVRHVVRDGGWETFVDLGMAPEAFASQNPAIAAPPAAGLTPPVQGLHIGQVKQVAQDPTGDVRVLVTMPLVGGDNGIWARLASPYASKTFGIGFWPEVGDEVLLGFMEEDPAFPVILGGLYSAARAPTYPPNDANDKKAIVTRSKMEITFDDKDIVLEIKTPGNRKVRLDDKAKIVEISDPFGNKMTMEQDKVAITAAAELHLTSGTDMKITAGANLTVKAALKCAISALEIAAAADTKLSLSGQAVGELKSSGMLTIAGALVKIN